MKSEAGRSSGPGPSSNPAGTDLITRKGIRDARKCRGGTQVGAVFQEFWKSGVQLREMDLASRGRMQFVESEKPLGMPCGWDIARRR
jgi:hypothetical protein